MRKPIALKKTSLLIILCLFCLSFFLKAKGQNSSAIPETSFLVRIKESAIHSGNSYIEMKLYNKQMAKQFIADSNFSLIICDDYKTFFSTNAVWCSPVGYEVAFHVVLETNTNRDTLHTHLFLPLDSSFKVNTPVADMWHDDLLRAWEMVISNKHKVNYPEVLQFAKRKKLNQFSIDFGYEGAGYKSNSRIYWFVTSIDREKKNKHPFLYRINPKTGAVKRIKLRPLKLPKEVP
jgi:hypothetical protein